MYFCGQWVGGVGWYWSWNPIQLCRIFFYVFIYCLINCLGYWLCDNSRLMVFRDDLFCTILDPCLKTLFVVAVEVFPCDISSQWLPIVWPVFTVSVRGLMKPCLPTGTKFWPFCQGKLIISVFGLKVLLWSKGFTQLVCLWLLSFCVCFFSP